MRRVFRKRVPLRWFIAVVVIELVTFAAYWGQSRPLGKQAFLMKSGDQYLLTWVDQNKNPGLRSFNSTEEAMGFANELALRPSPNLSYEDGIEALWVRKDIGKVVLYWKTNQLPFVNRLTFRNSDDAAFFERSFRQGAYSSSPIGHAVHFAPTEEPPSLIR